VRETDFGFIVMLNIFGCVLHLLNVILQSRVTQLLILTDLDLYEKRHKWDPSNGSGARFFVISLVVVGVLLLLCVTFKVRCGIFATSLILLLLLLLTLWDLHDLQQLYTMVPCGAMDPVNVHNRIATNKEETCETKKCSFLLGLSDAYNLKRNFLGPWTIFSYRTWNKTKNHGPQILYMCNFVLAKTNDN
jgi:hypothetical protein